jgi:hypothetical protein
MASASWWKSCACIWRDVGSRGWESVAADATYGNGEFLRWLLERGITPHMRT